MLIADSGAHCDQRPAVRGSSDSGQGGALLMSNNRELVKLLQANVGSKRLSQVFDDFVEMSALAFRNTVDLRGRDAREEQYLRVADQYDGEALDRFGQALALVILEVEREPGDVLGHLYMDLALGNEHMGQFFTPYDVARMIAAMNAEGLAQQVTEHGFAQLYEPACGAGAFIVAASQAMRETGLNPQQQLHVTAEDLSSTAVHMVYIHLTLLHIPAVVHHRNTLTQETHDSWFTPAHIFGGWAAKVRLQATTGAALRLLKGEMPDEAFSDADAALQSDESRRSA